MEISDVKEIFRKFLRELIFDNSCSCCSKNLDREGYLCSTCLNKLKNNSFLKNNEDFYYCFYYDNDIRTVISDYKIRNRKNLAKDLAFLVREPIEILLKKENIDIIIPVPISKKREKERGFNQVEYLLDVLKIKYNKIERIKNTKHMYGLKDKKEREKNVANVFKSEIDLSNKKILLVDDIVTTGATIKSIINEIEKSNKNVEIKVFSIAISKKFSEKVGDINGNLHRQ